MNWAEIRRLYISACGEAPSAGNEALIHLNQAYFEVTAQLDIQELEDEATVTLAQGDESVALPTNLYHIRHVDNITNGRRMDPEQGGMRGRSRYLNVNSGSVAQGMPLFYVASQGLLFVRPAADGAYSLRIRGKFQPTEITESDWGTELSVPLQYQLAIAHAAARSYMLSHPGTTPEQQQASQQLAGQLKASIAEHLAEPFHAKERERFDMRGRLTLRGFRLNKR